MGTSTSTTYGPNGPQRTTTGETIRARTVRAITVRAQGQVEEATPTRPRPTLAGPGGTVRPLGAADNLPVQRTNSRGAIPVGAAVDYSGGVTGAEGSGFGSALAQLARRLLEVARNRGPLITSGNPTDDPTLGARYAQDLAIDSEVNQLYYWRPATPTEDARWEPIGSAIEQIDVAIDVPANRDYLITYSQRYPCRIEALHRPPADYTIDLAPAVGTTLEVGDQITITLSGIPDGEDDEPPPPISLTIELRRLG